MKTKTKESFRLPNGKTTKNVETYCKTWQKLCRPIVKFFGAANYSFKMKVLTYTEKSGYAAQPGNLALGWIDKREGTAESRESEDERLRNKYAIVHSCAEEFMNCFDEESKSIIFYHNSPTAAVNLTENIRDFIALIENKLGLEKKSEVFTTTKNTVTAIRVAEFHRKNKMKRWMFVLFVRGGIYFEKNMGIDSVLNNGYTYLSQVKPLVNLYLDHGYTKFSETVLNRLYNDMHFGPVKQFKNLTEEQIKDVLMFKEEN